MALDKNKILNELGNVVSQLQSADCGCMGKLFSNNAGGGHRVPAGFGTGGCCHHAYSENYSSGEPQNGPPRGHPMMNNTYYTSGQANQPGMPTKQAGMPTNQYGGMGAHCMGSCNPPKLYADTYSYLNQNLMKPVVQEVYEDLKSITPANTIANNPMAAQMGLSLPGNSNMVQGSQPVGSGEVQHMNTNQMTTNQQSMRGMGPEIVNMVMGGGGGRHFSPSKQQMDNRGMPGNIGGVGGGSIANPEMGGGVANPGIAGVNMVNPGMGGNMLNTDMAGNRGMGSGNAMPIPDMTHPNARSTQNQLMHNSHIPTTPQQNMPQQQNYGAHTEGMKKFNDMFPGVVSKDLGFDPMAMAIQMNPANNHRSAIDTMQSMLMGKPSGTPNLSMAKSGLPQANTQQASVTETVGQPLQTQQVFTMQQNKMQPGTMQQGQWQPQQILPGQTQEGQLQLGQLQAGQSQPGQSQPGQLQPGQLQAGQSQPGQSQPGQSQPGQGEPGQIHPGQIRQSQWQAGQMQPQEQVYTAVTSNDQSATHRQRQIINGPPILPLAAEGSPHPGYILEQPPTAKSQPLEPLVPADTSRNMPPRHFEYNTLGQPVELLPADIYRPVESNLPQTLSPQPLSNYSNVKNTMSKTALMNTRPAGRQPSRSQLQHIYHQYKGSQSHTQQNIHYPGQGVSHSEGRLNSTMGNPQQVLAPVEKIAGDAAVNNQIPVGKPDERMERQIGDVNAAKPAGDILKAADAMFTSNLRTRNGLQDVVYTAYPKSQAWSFHGQRDCSSRSPTRHYR